MKTTLLVLSAIALPFGFSAQESPGSVEDIDGNRYRVVRVGDRSWMAENLRVTRYPDGQPVESSAYEELEENARTFGRLYDWAAGTGGREEVVTEAAALQGICPAGWRLPSRDDWTRLVDELGGEAEAGTAAKGAEHWVTAVPENANSSGFSALPAGFWNFTGEYMNLGVNTFFLASTRAEGEPVVAFTVEYNSSEFREVRLHPDDRVSIRCVR